MERRSKNEIERDYKTIRTIVSTTKVTSLNEIAKATGLSKSEVNTSLIRHPRIKEEILAQLKKNREDAKKAKKEAKNEAVETDKMDEEKKAENENTASEVDAKKGSKSVQTEKYFVLDASLCGISELEEIISGFEEEKSKVILTSVTIRELDRMQKFKDVAAADARYILSNAAQNQDMFFMVWIEENLETPDDCIIKYCADNKESVVLLTADKIMALKARAFGVETMYYIKGYDTSKIKSRESSYLEISTLISAKKVGEKLILSTISRDNRGFLVISKGIEYKECICNLEIGDDVYIATKKQDYMTFAHYKITSLNRENNCKLIYSKRIYGGVDEIKRLPKASYKSFMREFKHKQDKGQISVT